MAEGKIALFINMLGSLPLWPQMDQYCAHIHHIVQERKTSPRTCLLLQDVLDLKKVSINEDYSTWRKLVTLVIVNYKPVTECLSLFSNQAFLSSE